MCQKKANKIKLTFKKKIKLKTSKELHKPSPLREKAALWITKHWVLALVFRAVILLLYDCSNSECLFILLRAVEESIYTCGRAVLVHHDTGLCYWKWSWLICRQQDEWLTHPIRTRSMILERKYQKEERCLEMHGKVVKTKQKRWKSLLLSPIALIYRQVNGVKNKPKYHFCYMSSWMF